MGVPKFANWGDYLYWAHASMQMLCMAIREELNAYDRRCYAVRSKRWKAYKEGRQSVGSLYRNDVSKSCAPHDECWYCEAPVSECGELSADHILPRALGGGDSFSNLVFCCRECNSSKGKRDVVVWYCARFGMLPPIWLQAIYLKLVLQYSQEHDLLSLHKDELALLDLPFDFTSVMAIVEFCDSYFDDDDDVDE